MDMPRGIISIASCGLLLASMSATRFVVAGVRVSPSAHSEPEACTLLTAADASKALEVSSVSSKRMVASDPLGCMWSDDPAASDTSRRIGLNFHSPTAFKIAMRPAITTIKIESVSGIGDEGFYQLYPNASPFIWVRKGNTAISIRILTRIKPSRPFTIEQEKSKLAVLAKAALAKV
jgi:hypothetical protein